MDQKLSGFLALKSERAFLRAHNVNPGRRGPPLPLAEAAVLLIALERLLRLVLGPRAVGNSLRTLLYQATDSKMGSLRLDNKEEAILALTDVRNTILHGDFEGAARESGCSSVEEYFRTRFAGEVDVLNRTLDAFCAQLEGTPFS